MSPIRCRSTHSGIRLRWHFTDRLDPEHDSLRRHALWGSLLGGGSGVEWYFGARYPGNDLTSEDWRQPARIWELTRYALEFFEAELPYWEMDPCNGLTGPLESYCLAKPGQIYAIYCRGPGENHTGPRDFHRDVFGAVVRPACRRRIGDRQRRAAYRARASASGFAAG